MASLPSWKGSPLDEHNRGSFLREGTTVCLVGNPDSRAALLVISSELPEVVGICDRVVVMREGETRGEVGGDSGIAITEENIMALATGVDMTAVAA